MGTMDTHLEPTVAKQRDDFAQSGRAEHRRGVQQIRAVEDLAVDKHGRRMFGEQTPDP